MFLLTLFYKHNALLLITFPKKQYIWLETRLKYCLFLALFSQIYFINTPPNNHIFTIFTVFLSK